MPYASPRPRSLGLGRLTAFGVAGLCGLTPTRVTAQASAVEVDAEDCPSEELVRQQLEPLLGGDEALTSGDGALVSGQRAQVLDLGERYSIEIGSARREVRDPGRDCLERARVAAVFIALNVKLANARAPAPAPVVPAPGLTPPPPPPLAPVARPPSRTPRLGAQLFIEAAYAPEGSLATTGAGLGLSLRGQTWIAVLSGAILAPVELELQPGAASAGAVSILRIPLGLTVMPSWRAGPLELGPVAGAALDVLSFRGERLARTDSAVRINPGGTLGLGARWLLSRNWWAFTNVTASAFPMEYRLRVEPSGTLGRAPPTWLGVSLGFGGSSAP